jgi:hypothetical protein
MNELERLGRIGFERVRQVVEDGIDRAGVALQPLVELMVQRLEALWQVLSFLVQVLIWIWLQMALAEVFEKLAADIGRAVNTLLTFLFVAAVALVAVVNVLFVVMAIALHRRGR